jgi:hypothetical protein
MFIVEYRVTVQGIKQSYSHRNAKKTESEKKNCKDRKRRKGASD